MNAEQIQEIAPSCSSGWAVRLADEMPRWHISTPQRQAMFLAQCAHESAGFTRFEENLNYSAEALQRTWPSRFPSFAAAAEVARQPERIANRVYADRLGNGNEASGDGWRFRGRGAIQITGRSNYRRAGLSLGFPLEANPTEAALPGQGARVACWYWFFHGLNDLADDGDFEGITRRINGGLTGIVDRERWLAKACAVIPQ